MPSFLSNIFKSKDARHKKGAAFDASAVAPARPRWEESWSRKTVSPEEVEILIHECTQEMKSRALDMPFLLLPFRPGSDPVGSKSFIRNYFKLQYDYPGQNISVQLRKELRLMEPLVLCSIIKWCWNRLSGGVITWEVYELFKTGESDADLDSHAFTTFVPISAESDARKNIIFDFFDLLAAIAARGKTNGLGGRKLSRMAGWWAFEHSDRGEGFNGGYQTWKKAANATSHMFFAYLRSLSPDAATDVGGILSLPRSLQALVSQTEYPPEEPSLIFKSTPRVLMIVDSVSPTPFALLRRAKHFNFRDDDQTLIQFSEYNDPVDSLNDECKRVLNRISAANESVMPSNGKTSAMPVPEGSWSRFEDMGFASISSDLATPGDLASGNVKDASLHGSAGSNLDPIGRPTTPSWGDFLSNGFPDPKKNPSVLLPPDKQLPHIAAAPRSYSSQSHFANGESGLEPGELAAVNYFDLDETFWWVWMTSLGSEETTERKAVFGRCALIETNFNTHPWLVIEEQVKGASPGQDEGVYLAEKKGLFSFGKRSMLSRRKTISKKKQSAVSQPIDRTWTDTPASRIDPEREDKIRAAARQLSTNHLHNGLVRPRDGNFNDASSSRRNSVMTLQPMLVNEATQALKWTSAYDNKSKNDIRSAYLENPDAGRGYDVSRDNLPLPAENGHATAANMTSPPLSQVLSERDLPALPKERREAEPIGAPPSPPTTPPGLAENAASVEMADHSPAVRAIPQKQKTQQYTPRSDSMHPRSPEMQTQEFSKPQKSSGGLKKLFSRRKATTPSRFSRPAQPVSAPAPPVPVFSATPYEPSDVEDESPELLASSDQFNVSKHDSATLEALEGRQHETRHEMPESHQRHASHEAPIPVESMDEHYPREEQYHQQDHHQFNQGPLEDVPASVPEDAAYDTTGHRTRMGALLDPHLSDHNAANTVAHKEIAPEYHPTSYEQTPTSKVYEGPSGYASSVDDESAPAPVIYRRPISGPSASDRWAQIRKNAAERAAKQESDTYSHKQQSSQYSGQSKTTTDVDEGETSGEETIESRVARIKARVAELTGNMEASSGYR